MKIPQIANKALHKWMANSDISGLRDCGAFIESVVLACNCFGQTESEPNDFAASQKDSIINDASRFEADSRETSSYSLVHW